MMEIAPDLTIDARHKGSIARLLNSVRPTTRLVVVC